MIYLNDRLFDFDLNDAIARLSPQRREQALRYRHELGQRTSAAAYLLLCEALEREYGISEKPFLAYEENGKPYLADHPNIHFNLSHCREAAICVVSNEPFGVDIESIREFKPELLAHTMNDDEQEHILRTENPAIAFTRLWTMKEAALKWSGLGIRCDLKTVLTGRELTETHVNAERGYVYSICRGIERK